jgi:hypothetical protein
VHELLELQLQIGRQAAEAGHALLQHLAPTPEEDEAWDLFRGARGRYEFAAEKRAAWNALGSRLEAILNPSEPAADAKTTPGSSSVSRA